MNSVLINGNYSVEDAEQLLQSLFRVKTEFHQARIESLLSDAQDISDSEKRLIELQSDLEKVLQGLRKAECERVVMHARLVLEFCPAYENA